MKSVLFVVLVLVAWTALITAATLALLWMGLTVTQAIVERPMVWSVPLTGTS